MERKSSNVTVVFVVLAVVFFTLWAQLQVNIYLTSRLEAEAKGTLRKTSWAIDVKDGNFISVDGCRTHLIIDGQLEMDNTIVVTPDENGSVNTEMTLKGGEIYKVTEVFRDGKKFVYLDLNVSGNQTVLTFDRNGEKCGVIVYYYNVKGENCYIAVKKAE